MSDLKSLPPHQPGDIPIYHTVVRALSSAAVLAVGGAIVLALMGKTIPDSVVALGSAALGALAGLLAPSPSSK